MGSNLRRCENETAILLLATSQPATEQASWPTIYIASSWLCVRICYANPASETCSRGPKHSSRQHKTSALATVEIKNRRGGGSKYLHFDSFCVPEGILRQHDDAKRAASAVCKINLAPQWECFFFKCLRDLSVGVMDNDLRPAQKTQFFISDSHQ